MQMQPAAYGSPQALFAAGGGMATFTMDPFGNLHATGGPAMAPADAYGQPAVFTAQQGVSGGPAYALYAASSPAGQPQLIGAPGDEIRTVFVSGFPHDVKERELHNLLRFMPGYEASQMNWKTGGPQGFALFATAVHARAVVEVLSGLQFDDAVVIRAEMAHKNMFIKPEDPSVKRVMRHSPSMLGPTAVLAPVPQLPGASLAPAPPSMSPGGPAFLAAAAAAGASGSPTLAPSMLGPMGLGMPLRPAAFSPVTNLRDNPPCNTLFIGNLGDNTNEQELRTLLSSQPGYRQLKMVRGPKATTAFVEFSDVGSAMMVHATLQGAVLASSDRGGIRVQYSKNPFGRRDVTSASPHAGSIGGGSVDAGQGSDSIGQVSSQVNLSGSPGAAAAAAAAAAMGGVQAMPGASPGLPHAQLGASQVAAQGMAAAAGGYIGQAGLEAVLGEH